MAKPQETLSQSLIEEARKIELMEDIGYDDRINEQFIRKIYQNQSMPKLEFINRLLSVIIPMRSKNGPTFLVGLYPSGKYFKMREETRIKESLLIDLLKQGHIRNLYSRIVDIPDAEGPFTTDAIVADFQFIKSDLINILKNEKTKLERKIRIDTGNKIKFDNGYIKFGEASKSFEGGQELMMKILFDNRQEYLGKQLLINGKSVSTAELRKAGNYDKKNFRSALKHCRAKLKFFEKEGVKIEIKNIFRGKGKYQLAVHYPIG